MPKVTCHMTVSLDGFVAGPDQSLEHPMGRGGAMQMHRWHFGDTLANEADERYRDALMSPRGAYVMGRNMFGPIRGAWGDSDWQGWWEQEPPYHAPVFVLTHHERDPVELLGGTTFHFVTGGFEAALAAARQAAGDLDVDIAGGASIVAQALRADAIDELTLDVAPVVLGSGERLFADVPESTWEIVDVAHSPLVTHLKYRRVSG